VSLPPFSSLRMELLRGCCLYSLVRGLLGFPTFSTILVATLLPSQTRDDSPFSPARRCLLLLSMVGARPVPLHAQLTIFFPALSGFFPSMALLFSLSDETVTGGFAVSRRSVGKARHVLLEIGNARGRHVFPSPFLA